ncbi:MAG TPA: hypothetical protein VIF62_06290 [Labilithrix sp.]|jgi:hypothetical protein
MKRVAIVSACLLSAALGATIADAQRVDPRRASTFVVGTPAGPAPMQRVDAKRSGASKQPLPSGQLTVAWRKTIGLSVDQPALAGADGTVAIVTARGDVVFLDEAGEEKGHVTVDGRSAGPAAMTSDGTVVFATSSGDAVGVRRVSPRPRFVSRIGGERNTRAAPLPLDDGGVVVATTTDLVVLDSEGNVRQRVTLADGAAAPLVAAGDKVLAVSSAGTVYGWTPGREPVRMGSFGAPIDGGAALVDESLVAVIEGNHLVDLDLAHGSRGTRSISQAGLYLGPPAVRRDAKGATLATVLSLTPTRLAVVTLDAAGTETLRAPIGGNSLATLADGGIAPLVAPLHTGPLVDARGVVAWASTDGHVGVVTSDGAVEPLGEVLCSRSGRSAGIAGLTPVGRGAFVVTCDSGTIARVQGPTGS